MAEKETDARKPSPNGLVVRCSPEWRDWLKRLSKHSHLPMATVLEHGAMEYARKVGFKEGAPER